MRISIDIPLQYLGFDYDDLMPSVITAAKPKPQALSACFTCLFSQETRILPSILPPSSVFYCLQHRAVKTGGDSGGSKYKYENEIHARVLVCCDDVQA